MRRVQTTNLAEEDDSHMMTECAKNILGHLERNIILNRNFPELSNRMSDMHRYIRVNYVLGLAYYPQFGRLAHADDRPANSSRHSGRLDSKANHAVKSI